ncbi:MAG TPA: MSMEG_0565 family glycosyltransferase [Thermodesulfobacteriota bacterium]|nr:MSMEG_0565 family glycosyltransferase [Thermodesulfobacteriota bacterium]
MKSLKIALLTYSTKPRGGVVHTLSLAEELAHLGHRVHIYALSGGEGFFRPVGVPYTLIPCENLPDEGMDEKVKRYINTYSTYLAYTNLDCDIYHAEDCISANALLVLRNLGLIKSFIRTVHHVDDFTSPSLIECQLRSIIEPDHIIVVSKFWENELRSRFSLNPTVINNGVDVERFKITGVEGFKDKAKEDFLVSGCRVILSVGGIEPRKNTLTTLRAFGIAKSYFKEKGERLVWLIGGGETLFDYRVYRDEFFSEVKRSGCRLDEDIILLGNVPDDSMTKLYGAADVLVFPSVKEGWGLVVFEAMASGLPVIASIIEPLTEYLGDEENSLLVSPMDYEALAHGIIRAMENPELRDRLIKNGRKTAESYSWRTTALKHEEFYEGILESVDIK